MPAAFLGVLIRQLVLGERKIQKHSFDSACHGSFLEEVISELSLQSESVYLVLRNNVLFALIDRLLTLTSHYHGYMILNLD